MGVPVFQAANGFQNRDDLTRVIAAFDLEDHLQQIRFRLLLPLHVQYVTAMHREPKRMSVRATGLKTEVGTHHYVGLMARDMA